MASDQAPRVINVTDAEVRSVAVSRSGRWLAAGIRYGQVKVFNLETSAEHLSFKAHESDVWSVAFTNDSQTLATANGDWNRPGHVKLWNAQSGQQAGSFQHTGEVLSLAISPTQPQLAAGAADKTVRIWTLPSDR